MTKIIAIECQKCGAPLDVLHSHNNIAVCGSCGMQHIIEQEIDREQLAPLMLVPIYSSSTFVASTTWSSNGTHR